MNAPSLPVTGQARLSSQADTNVIRFRKIVLTGIPFYIILSS